MSYVVLETALNVYPPKSDKWLRPEHQKWLYPKTSVDHVMTSSDGKAILYLNNAYYWADPVALDNAIKKVDVHYQNATDLFKQEYPSIPSQVYDMSKSMEDAAQEEQRRYANMLKYPYYEIPTEQIPVISPGFYLTLQEITSTPCRGTGYLTIQANRKIHVARIHQPGVDSKRWSVIVDINSYEFSFDYMTFSRSVQAEGQSDLLQTVDNFTKRQREVEIKQKEAEVKEKMAVVNRLTAARTKLVNAAADLGMVTRGETKHVRITNESAKRYEGCNGTVASSSMKNPQMGPGYKQLEVGYDDPTGDDFLVGVNEW